jgi:uncharacterized protein involved in exopolysaccharide biosynthesis
MSMMENRQLTVDDYLAMFRRRIKMILIPTLLSPLVGFGVSYLFQPKYTSRATVLVEEPTLPEGAIPQDISNRVATVEQRVLTAEGLRPLIESLKLGQGSSVGGKMNDIRQNIAIQPMPAIPLPVAGGERRAQVPGFFLEYTAADAHEAQNICAGLVDLILQENLKEIGVTNTETNDFLARQIEDEKRKLDEMDKKVADFQKQHNYTGTSDAEKNMQVLMTLNSQLDANTQSLNRAQQDKAFTESMLSQQIAAWKASQTSSGANPQALDKQLSDLQSQLLSLKTRYTDDYPEVQKTKRDIQELQRQIAAANAAASSSNTTSNKNDKSELNEPPEIRGLRVQIYQLDQTIKQATREQQKLQDQIRDYQGRVALSPAIEEEYKQLTRDYQTMQKVYDDDLARKRGAEKQQAVNVQQLGQRMTVLNAADLPQSPSFPNRLLFGGGGLAGGLALGLGLALWLELRDQCVRTEQDVLSVLQLPVLSQVPWVRDEDSDKHRGRQGKPGMKRFPQKEKEIVEV